MLCSRSLKLDNHRVQPYLSEERVHRDLQRRRDNLQPCMRVDFPRWEGDSMGWISRAEHYFRYYRMSDDAIVEITIIYLEAGDSGRSKVATTVHSYGGDFLCTYSRRTIEPRGMKDKGCSSTSHAEAYSPLYYHPSPRTKKMTRDELRERSAKGLCWHCDEPWSREHHCKKDRLLMIEPVDDEDNEPSEEAIEPKEEAMEKDSQPADYVVHALVGYSNPQTMKVGGLLK
ncbi:hypothetical protein B296_00017057 [Ensete ventricosum]|uniref:Uncharacterized protein n=1 Tax=Ensete ventricosum TaxID=4639 RepID=A0A426Z1X4_ENSVE|nr:hypothetical protein B296_00017057 [Ensete ventricosum]